jgi:hypothetical protein
MKMMWSDTYLYVCARMTESHLWAYQKEKNSIIYHENDFEVFIDIDGCNHMYYEFEINAANAIWELLMVKPYKVEVRVDVDICVMHFSKAVLSTTHTFNIGWWPCNISP